MRYLVGIMIGLVGLAGGTAAQTGKGPAKIAQTGRAGAAAGETSAQRPVVRRIEPCACPVKVDSNFKTRCGYLVVPENRTKNNGKTIKLPFVIAYSNNPHKKKDPILFTTGGPGGSSLGWVTGATKHSMIEDRDCIAFEQRGTQYAVPNLWSNELSKAIREAYRKNLSKDSMTLVGVRRYKKALEVKGIDLSGYNTDETVSDIDDLLLSLRIDSINLVGVSYSGGLMLAVLQRDPARVRSLILDSPLPTFVPIDEDEPANFNEALSVLFRKCDSDSADKEQYGNLREKFDRYFTSLGTRPMTIAYVEKGRSDTLHIQYTRNELYDIIIGSLYNRSRIKDAPYLITEIMKGHHREYMQQFLDGLFGGDGGPSGMRLSVYCADQTAYHEERIRRELNGPYPFMEGYHINDVYREMCDCWQVPPIRRATKQPFYSDKPALLADGELDPACRPLYIDRIHHYMPGSQRLLGINRGHGVFYGMAIDGMLRAFLDNPYQKVVSGDPELVVY